MGMDIHIHIEYRSKRNGEWRCGDYFKINYEPYGDEPKFEPVEICGERNYHRFAVLADMRNDFNVIPISEARGLPSDVSEDVKAMADRYSHFATSWLTFEEIGKYLNIHTENMGEKYEDREGNKIRSLLFRPDLNVLADTIYKRAAELNVLPDSYFNWVDCWTHENCDNVRIVFWFDV